MVNIGKAQSYIPSVHTGQPVDGVRWSGGGNSGAGSSSLQSRLEAIDRGESTVFTGGTSFANAFSSDNVMARIEAIGTGELRPNTGRDFDMLA